MSSLLPIRTVDAIPAAAGAPIDEATMTIAADILRDVTERGDSAARAHGERLGDIAPDQPLLLGPDEMAAAFRSLAEPERRLLTATADRIRAFANAQRDSVREFDRPLAGGRAGQRLAPVRQAGCYVPGGRASLPSSMLMTAVTARAAGVATVFAASPRPTAVVLAAAHVAGCDGLLAIGGAQAIAALATGDGTRAACDVVVGPGNRFVTAAKLLLQGRVGVDLPAGPSELCVVADGSADPRLVAADLIAQAEHDPDARAWLLCLSDDVRAGVERELRRQLDGLATADVARQALSQGGVVPCRDLDEAVQVADRLAPEHLQLALADGERVAHRFANYGALFSGAHGAEVLGDYGAGPNHVLPTAGAARFAGGLSVFSFLRIRTWLHLDRPDDDLLRDAARLAELEGLPGHANAARMRCRQEQRPSL